MGGWARVRRCGVFPARRTSKISSFIISRATTAGTVTTANASRTLCVTAAIIAVENESGVSRTTAWYRLGLKKKAEPKPRQRATELPEPKPTNPGQSAEQRSPDTQGATDQPSAAQMRKQRQTNRTEPPKPSRTRNARSAAPTKSGNRNREPNRKQNEKQTTRDTSQHEHNRCFPTPCVRLCFFR